MHFFLSGVSRKRGVAFYAQERYREAVKHLCALPFQTRRSRLYQIAARMALGETDPAQSSRALRYLRSRI
jgi:adenylate cyclase